MVSVFYRHWGPIDRLFFLLPVISYCIVSKAKRIIPSEKKIYYKRKIAESGWYRIRKTAKNT